MDSELMQDSTTLKLPCCCLPEFPYDEMWTFLLGSPLELLKDFTLWDSWDYFHFGYPLIFSAQLLLTQFYHSLTLLWGQYPLNYFAKKLQLRLRLSSFTLLPVFTTFSHFTSKSFSFIPSAWALSQHLCSNRFQWFMCIGRSFESDYGIPFQQAAFEWLTIFLITVLSHIFI